MRTIGVFEKEEEKGVSSIPKNKNVKQYIGSNTKPIFNNYEPFRKEDFVLYQTPKKQPLLSPVVKATIMKQIPIPPVKPLPVPPDHKKRVEDNMRMLLEASYMSIEQASKVAFKEGFYLDRSLSDDDTFVYLDTLTGFPLITHRGSTTLYDWLIEDPLIATGLAEIISPRVSKARQITARVKDKYKETVDAIGHSLGGRVAAESGADGFIYTYNKAVGVADIFKKVNENETDIRTPKDPVSILAHLQRKKNIQFVGSLNDAFIYSHGLGNLPQKN